MSKKPIKTYDTFYRWVGTESAGFPWVRISPLEWGCGSDWEEICRSRPMLCRRIYKGWDLYPPKLRWDDAKWGDWNSWRRVLGDRRPWFRPNITIEIGYGPDYTGRFFFEGFRLAPIGLTEKAAAEKVGCFMALVFGRLPAPGEHSDVIMIKNPHSEENQIFWLGVILQGSRMVLG